MSDPSAPTARAPFKILILSAGSLLSQNILDAVETRRRQLRIIGADAAAENARLYRCDMAYLTPPLDDQEAFAARFAGIVSAEQPDIVFPGRDHDVNFLAWYGERNPGGRMAVPCGSSRASRIMHDKTLSHAFCLEEDLPTADTLPLEPGLSRGDLHRWLDRVGLPVLAKPRQGFGSLGIRFILSKQQSDLLPLDGSHLLQEFIGTPPELSSVKDTAAQGVPLFFTIPVEDQFAGQTLISPDGGIGEVCCTRSKMVLGRCEASWPVRDEAMAEVVRKSARAFGRLGWRGSLNVQLRRRDDGSHAIQEFGGRMSGSTSARRHLGYDEVRLLCRAFAGHDLGPAPDEHPPREQGYVVRSLTDYFMPEAKAATLRENGVWQR